MNELRWGILGTANIADAFIGAVRMGGCGVIAAVASRDIDHARSWAAQRDIPRAFGSYESLLESGEVDLIYNPLPNTFHAQWSIKALEAGLPVLCEKPVAITAQEASLMQQASNKAGLPLVEGFMYRHHPIYDKLQQVIGEGTIGRVVTVNSWFTFALDDPSEIPASAELGGGALMDVGCYCINLSRLIAGCEPLRVFAFERRDEVDATMTGLLEFPGGMLAHFDTSIECYERHRAEIVGTRGRILLNSPWIPGEDKASFLLSTVGGETEVETAGGNCYRLQAQDFLNAVIEKRSPRWAIDDAVANMAVIDALFESGKSGKSAEI
jgi:D-xylose 1-dehydrogenase (NADP+, D-xylono-1,5-lactone-forming)